MKYEIEHDEEKFFKAAKSENEQIDFGQLNRKKKVRNAKKLYQNMANVIGEFEDDSEAKESALDEYICSTYLINCPADESEFDKDTLDEARQAAKKRFRKKLSQLEQLGFFQMREMKNEIVGLKAQLAELQQKCETLQKARPENGKSLKRKRQTFENAPKKPLAAREIFKQEKVDAGFSGEELKAELDKYKGLTDDEKSKYYHLAKKQADIYTKELKTYTATLDEDDREVFLSSSKIRRVVFQPSAKSLFPDKPKPKAVGIYFYWQSQNSDKIDKAMKKKHGNDVDLKKLATRSAIAKELWDKVSESKKEKLKVEQAELKEEDAQILKSWYESLEEERQAMYDRANLLDKDRNAVIPPWLEEKPPAPPATLHYFLYEICKRKLGANREAIKQEMKVMKKDAEKCKKKFDKCCKKYEKADADWLDALNPFQRELYDDYVEAQKIPATNEKELEFLSTLVKEIDGMENDDDKLNHLTDPDILEQIRKIYVKSIGFKKTHSTKEQEKKWRKLIAKGDVFSALYKYVKDARGSEKEDGKTGPKAVKKSAFEKKMEKEFGAGHPPKPRSVYMRFTDQCKAADPSVSKKDISAKYRRISKSESLALNIEFEADMKEYKRDVKRWSRTLSPEKKAQYEEKHMRGKLDRDETEDEIELQPKTPMIYEPNDSDKIEELEDSEE